MFCFLITIIISIFSDPQGDLKQFLLATRSDNGRREAGVPALTMCQKLGIGQQVASGMEALSSQGIVHGDIAARNVMLTSRLQPKLSRPALCGDVYASEYYPLHQRLVPLRWLPPEAVLEDKVTAAGDIWAFGVFLWEVMQLADLPYRLLSDEEVLRALQLGHAALEPSEICPSTVLDVAHQCTAHQPAHRPSFSELNSVIGQLVSNTELV